MSGEGMGLLGLVVLLMLSPQSIDVCVWRWGVAILRLLLLLLLQTRVDGTGCGHAACRSRVCENKVESSPARRRMGFAKVGFRQQRFGDCGGRKMIRAQFLWRGSCTNNNQTPHW